MNDHGNTAVLFNLTSTDDDKLSDTSSMPELVSCETGSDHDDDDIENVTDMTQSIQICQPDITLVDTCETNLDDKSEELLEDYASSKIIISAAKKASLGEVSDMIQSLQISQRDNITVPDTHEAKLSENSEVLRKDCASPENVIIASRTSSVGEVSVFPATTNAHRIYYKSLAYLQEEVKFNRNFHGDITYNGQLVCRYFSTSRGCRQGERCRFVHINLGCVFHQMAHQGCVYAESGDCPFSHEPDAVVMAPTLSNCKNFSTCGHSCMFTGSTCLTCFNQTARDRRERVRHQQHERRQDFQDNTLLPPVSPAPPASSFQSFYNPVPTTRSYFPQPIVMQQQERQEQQHQLQISQQPPQYVFTPKPDNYNSWSRLQHQQPHMKRINNHPHIMPPRWIPNGFSGDKHHRRIHKNA
jgi:hypothetical protein